MEYELFTIPSDGIKLREAMISQASVNNETMTISIRGFTGKRYVNMLVTANYGKLSVMQELQPIEDIIEIAVLEPVAGTIRNDSIADRLLAGLIGTFHMHPKAFEHADMQKTLERLTAEAPYFEVIVKRKAQTADKVADLLDLTERRKGVIIRGLVAIGSSEAQNPTDLVYDVRCDKASLDSQTL